MPDYVVVELTRGQVALVDTGDYERVRAYRWFAHRSRPDGAFYAVAHIGENGRRRMLAMHRLLMDAPSNTQVDHINRNTLDNRRSTNLRLASHASNQQNQSLGKNNHTGFKGISPFIGKGDQRPRWRAEISADGAPRHLGYFDTPEEAARAYDAAARGLHGSFAVLNFPDEVSVAPPHPRARYRNNTLGYIGVTRRKGTDRWRAQVNVDGKRTMIGTFTTAEDAARAYDEAAKRLYGDKARLNFPDQE